MNFSSIMAAAANISPEVMKVLNPILLIIMTIVSIATIVVILMQKTQEANIGAISGNDADTYMGKNKGRSKESILKKVTIILGAVLLVVSVVYFILQIFQ